ncbi:MAG TPA: hypothetical protein VMN76_03905 [Acidobacteriota bacterium]|nr:hypothetical protein [Acidobacteriota bacterium]
MKPVYKYATEAVAYPEQSRQKATALDSGQRPIFPETTARQILYGGRLLAAALGWSLFVAWWIKVWAETERTWMLAEALFITVVLVALILATFIWVNHNLRIARRGRRRKTVPPDKGAHRLERDRLNRPIERVGPISELDSQLVSVWVKSGRKIYVAEGTERKKALWNS